MSKPSRRCGAGAWFRIGSRLALAGAGLVLRIGAAAASGSFDANDIPAPVASAPAPVASAPAPVASAPAPVASAPAPVSGAATGEGGCQPYEVRYRAIPPRPRLSAAALLTRGAP